MSDIRRWLEQHGFGKYADAFAQHDIGLDILTALGEQQLEQVGVTLGDRVRMLRTIAALESDLADGSPEIRRSGRTHSSEAERRQLTVMFADLVGSTALSEQLDPEDFREIIRGYQDAAKGIIEGCAGYIARYMGDGVLAYFGYPQANEDDAQRAVKAGLELAKSIPTLTIATGSEHAVELAVRVGIATGPVVVGDTIGEGAAHETPAIGDTPNIAARLQSLAEPNAVLIAPTTHKLTKGHFRCQDIGEKALKGICNPVRLWRALDENVGESRFEAAHGQQLTPFIGRTEELALLLGRWNLAKDGEGQIVIISGEPGIGKSRLTAAVHSGISPDVHTYLNFQCSPFHTNSSLYPVISHLAHVLRFSADATPREKFETLTRHMQQAGIESNKDLALFATLLSIPVEDELRHLGLDTKRRRERTLMALLSLLDGLAARRPVLCVFEDIHWIDPTTLEFLSLLAAQVERARILLLVTHRPEFKAPWAGQSISSAIALGRIGTKHSRAMVDALRGGVPLSEEVRTEIISKSDGVPLFIEELAKSVFELREHVGGAEAAPHPLQVQIPSTLRDLLVARLDRLSAGKQVAQIAAVLGREFPYDLIEQVSGLETEKLDEGLQQLLSHGLVLSRGATTGFSFSFKHALLQDAAYESLLRSKRRYWHSRVAAVLEENYPEIVETRPELLAHHSAEAGLTAQAIAFLRQSGERAGEQGASTEAIHHYRKALDLLAEVPDMDERARLEVKLQIGLAKNLRVVGRIDESFEILERAENPAADQHFSLELAQIHHLRGNLCFPRGDIDGCLKAHRLSLQFAREARSVECEATALGGLGDAEYVRGRMLSANKAFSRTVELCRQHGFDRTEVANFAMVAHTRLYLNELQGAVDDAKAAIEAAVSIGHERAELIALNAAIIAYLAMDEAESTLDWLERREELIRHLGARLFEAESLRFRAQVLAAKGEKKTAVTLLKRAMEMSRETAASYSGPWILADLAGFTSDASERLEALNEAEEILRAGSVSHCHLWFCSGAMDASAAALDWARVERYATALETYTRFEPLPWSDFHVARGHVLAAYIQGKRERDTVRELHRLREQAVRIGLRPALAAMDGVLARLPPNGEMETLG